MKLFIPALLFILSIPSFAQNALDCRLAQTPTHYVLKAKNILQATMRISSDFGLPAGIEWVNAPNPAAINMTFSNTSVKDMLGSLVTSQPGYGIDFGNGIVHVYFLTLKDDPANVQNERLASLTAQDELVGDVEQRLRRAVRDLRTPKEARSSGSGCAGSRGAGAGERRMSFSFHDISVREVLDEEIKTGGYAIWTVTFSAAQPELTPTGYFYTQSIHNPDFPASAQPTWDLFFWGFDPVRRGFTAPPTPTVTSCASASLSDRALKPDIQVRK